MRDFVEHMTPDELATFHYIRTFALMKPPKRSDTDMSTKKASELLIKKLRSRDIYITQEFAEQVVDVCRDRDWLTLMVPVLAVNICWVYRFLGWLDADQTIEHHMWLTLLHQNAVELHSSLYCSLKENLTKLNYWQDISEEEIQNDELAAHGVAHTMRECSHSPTGAYQKNDKALVGALLYPALSGLQNRMCDELPITLQDRNIEDFIASCLIAGDFWKKNAATFSFGEFQQLVARANREGSLTRAIEEPQLHPHQQAILDRLQAEARLQRVPKKPVTTFEKFENASDGFDLVPVVHHVFAGKALRAGNSSSSNGHDSYKNIHGHNSAEPWKNKGNRGRHR